MKEPTVEMTLTEYKELEARVSALNRIETGTKGPIFLARFSYYAGEFIVVDDEANTFLVSELARVIKERDAAYQKLRPPTPALAEYQGNGPASLWENIKALFK